MQNTFSSFAPLVWIDLEMTGLNPHQDVILEIATIITDTELNIIAQGPVCAIHYPLDKLPPLEPFVRHIHTHNGLLDRVAQSTTTLAQAEEETLTFIQQYCSPHTSPLCGNSIWQDKQFLFHHMPRIPAFLHYRIIDVSSIKELITYWYEPNLKKILQTTIKKDTHNALTDIIESIEELKFYKKTYFTSKPTCSTVNK